MSDSSNHLNISAAELDELRARLAEAEDILRAIRTSEVDSLVVEGPHGAQIFSLQSAESASNRLRGHMIDHVSDAVIAVDSEERVVYINPAAERNYNIRAADILGRNLSDIYTRLWTHEKAEDEAREVLRQSGEWHGEVVHRTWDGRALEVELSVSVLRDEHGLEQGMIAVIRDITSRKQVETQLRESEERQRVLTSKLEELVQTRTEELVLTRNRLRALASELTIAEQRVRKKLASDLHDYLTQLLALSKIKLTQTLKAAMSETLYTRITETEQILTRALEYTRTLVAQLSPPILNEFGLRSALQWLAEQMRSHELAVSLEWKAAPLQLPEDQAVLIFQSVRELLINVTKHAKTREARVLVTDVGDTLRLTVSDQGVGFETAAVLKPQRTPVGFGLFSIRERMTAMGGSFGLWSDPGMGTVATLTLPLSQSSGSLLHERPSSAQDTVPFDMNGQIGQSPPHPHHDVKAPIRVLLVDDHLMVRQGLRSILHQSDDLEIVGEASDGEEALRCAEQLRPAVVLMDINMPKMNGIEATAAIKTRYPDTIVLGLTVNTEEDIQTAMVRAGATTIVTKEAAVDQLNNVIRRSLATRKNP